MNVLALKRIRSAAAHAIAVRRRTVLVHFHLFKNGGTSVERMLRESLGERWQSYDKPESSGKISANEIVSWIESNPTVAAVSSHQLVGPLPTASFDILPIVFLRHPLARVRSAWRFEWQKQLELSEPKGSLAAYVDEKFRQKRTSVIANFQVSRLGNPDADVVTAPTDRYDRSRLQRACEMIDALPFVGLVERFPQSLELMADCCVERAPALRVRPYHENATEASPRSIADEECALRAEIGDARFDELCARNRLDLELYAYAQGRFARQYARLGDRP